MIRATRVLCASSVFVGCATLTPSSREAAIPDSAVTVRWLRVDPREAQFRLSEPSHAAVVAVYPDGSTSVLYASRSPLERGVVRARVPSLGYYFDRSGALNTQLTLMVIATRTSLTVNRRARSLTEFLAEIREHQADTEMDVDHLQLWPAQFVSMTNEVVCDRRADGTSVCFSGPMSRRIATPR